MNTCVPPSSHRAFTLLELLVVIVIIGVLAGISLPIYNRIIQQGAETKTLSNTHQMGAAMLLYAGDNNSQLPSRTITTSKWPTLLQPYVQNIAVYSSPIPDVGGKTYKVTDQTKYFDDTKNYTSYIYNGFNDMGTLDDPTYAPRLNLIDRASKTILLGIVYPQAGHFYMDLTQGDNTPSNHILNLAAFPNGSPYVFADGSSRILITDTSGTNGNMKAEPTTSGIYSDWYWLLDKSRTSVIQ